MRLVSEAIMIIHDDRQIELRPSLRAAYILNQKHGLQALWNGVFNEGNLTMTGDVLSVAFHDPIEARCFLYEKIDADGLTSMFDWHDALSKFLCMSFGLNDQSVHSNPAPKRSGKPQTIEEQLVKLFEHATGWLGWTPENAWKSTPAEITTAFHGLISKLKAIHGGKVDEETPDADKQYDPTEHELSPEQRRENFARLRALSGKAA